MTLEEMTRQMLIDRGLGYDHTQPNQMDVPTSVQPDDVPQTMPWDYEARAEALRCSVRWASIWRGQYAVYANPEQTLQRALDFHAFLIGGETPEDGNDE